MPVTIIPINGVYDTLACQGELPLEQAQKIVGGYVECVYSYLTDRKGQPAMQMILNEEGKLYGLPLNVRATELALWFRMICDDVIVGPAILLSGDNRWI